ncbi:MAG: molybdate ABC transporter substrate-binding protein [Burkholderiaceae bacterium]
MIGLRRRLVGALSALLIAGPGQPAFAAGRDLVVFAAASLKNALDDALELWQQNGSAPVVVSYAGSSTLARQLSMGAPADLFISADEAWMQVLRDERRLQAGSERLLLGNRLALIATTGAAVPADLLPPRPGMPLRAALGEAGRFALADPRHVPAGRYARAALEHLQVWAAVQSGSRR